MTSSTSVSAPSSLSTSSRLLVPVFSLTLFLSASLMFMVQPMAGKMMLPIVGGTPAAWVTAMAFFQISLLAGYFAAFVFSKMSAKTHAIFLIVFLALGALILPLRIGEEHMDIVGQVPSPFGVAKLLFFTISIPFIALSTVSSTIQRLFATTDHPDAKDPYFLYVASNLGSFVGLFSYPLLVEPFSGLSSQSIGWLGGYLGLIVLCFICFLSVLKHSKSTVEEKTETKTNEENDVNHDKITWKRRLYWIALAFVPSSLMMGVTLHITTDVMSMPMIWVLPLGLYLLTFVIAFSKQTFIQYKHILILHPLLVAIVVVAMNAEIKQSIYMFFGHLFAFTIVALMCHMTLMKKRPESTYLTEFYLFLSIGGALGGVLNAFLAPYLFNSQIEYPAVMAISCLLNPHFRKSITGHMSTALIVGMVSVAIFVLFVLFAPKMVVVSTGILVFAAAMFSLHPKSVFFLCIMAMLMGQQLPSNQSTLFQLRNFFGIVRVHQQLYPQTTEDMTQKDKDKQIMMLYMSHGTTVHGVQNTSVEHLTIETSSAYYGQPLQNIMNTYPIESIAVVGLGIGTLACYEQGHRRMTFYEIDPDIVDVARESFSYLKDCLADQTGKVILGDGRLSLVRQDETYDLIVLDAFSSDGVPVHLLTIEALKSYREKLNPNGLLAFNISNRFFELRKVITSTARQLDMDSRFLYNVATRKTRSIDPTAQDSQWMVVAPSDVDLSKMEDLGWLKTQLEKDAIFWTDDYSNLISMLNFDSNKIMNIDSSKDNYTKQLKKMSE